MTPPETDLSQPDGVRRELLDDDGAARNEFVRHFETELAELAAALADLFARLPTLSAAAGRAQTKRAALVEAFAIGVLDDLVVSTKLLLAGKLPAAGNVMRQVIEGIAISFLCSTDELLVVEMNKKQGPVRARYWEKLEGGDSRAHGHLALQQLEWNAAALGVTADAVRRLRLAKKHYNQFSHCGMPTFTSRAALDEPGKIYIGGHFDAAKLNGYRAEMNERIGLCRVLPPFLDRLLATMTPAPAVPVPVPAPAQQVEPVLSRPHAG
jgi:hypothetical protein